MENHIAIGFLFSTGPNLMGNHKATKPEFNVGPPWRFADEPMKAQF